MERQIRTTMEASMKTKMANLILANLLSFAGRLRAGRRRAAPRNPPGGFQETNIARQATFVYRCTSRCWHSSSTTASKFCNWRLSETFSWSISFSYRRGGTCLRVNRFLLYLKLETSFDHLLAVSLMISSFFLIIPYNDQRGYHAKGNEWQSKGETALRPIKKAINHWFESAPI